ncbi:MAG TPA: alpha/beta hydrolase [Ramlibacter sp.]|uniref:RBBP9/YdeN family alpha/beta hydrolase n=1 Tax=Ramlibacter sp. TaxID=1917967 RepID=UPI002D360F03|nr:alpha/beta hydrolase [Ramlibacter sp.]HZY17864.1 alpha/beta hydrolase [Ramlibacter sp.]
MHSQATSHATDASHHRPADFDGGTAWPAGSAQGPGALPLIVPGWRDSGAGHWQTLWAEQLPGALRVVQDDWVHPTRAAWVGTIARYVMEAPQPVVIVAHSLGCIAAVHLPPEAARRVRAALLVAPADPERRALLNDFAPVPHERLPYRSIVVASTNDPYCPSRLAGAYARAWGSEFVRLPGAGHINVESGHGEWTLGFALLQSLLARPSHSPFHIAI